MRLDRTEPLIAPHPDTPGATCPCCAQRAPADPGTHEECTCPRCGHRWQRAPVDDRYYETQLARNDLGAPWFKRKLAERTQAVIALLDQTSGSNVQRVLEIGCAEGALGRAIKSHRDVIYDGVELSRDAGTAEKILDRVYRVPSPRIEASPYDLIVAFHVLEHITDPVGELVAWRELLAPDGVLMIEVPNRAGHPLLVTDRHPEHLHHFTTSSLVALLGACGFDPYQLSTGHYESPVYPDAIRAIARHPPRPARQRSLLLERFRKRIEGPFVAYGIGGDYANYVQPLAADLELVALADSDPDRWGQSVGHLQVGPYQSEKHGDLFILICSIRFATSIRQSLCRLGVPPERIIGLDEIYEDA